MSEEIVEEVIEEVIVEEIKVDARLQKSVNLLIKQTNVDKEKLEGLNLEEQFDRLSFLAENLPKQAKSKNRPVVPLPTDINEQPIGRKVRVSGGSDFYLFKPSEWLGKKK